MIIICVFGAINELKCSGKEGKQHGPVGDGVLCSCLGMCMLLPAYPLMCASLHDCKTHFNLLIHFTWCACTVQSNPVRACGKEEPTGRSSNFATDLFILLIEQATDVYQDNGFIGVPPCATCRQTITHTHTRKSRWITGTARAVLGVNFS